MNFDELKKDAMYAHAIFDLCGIKSSSHGGQPMSLRLRAMILAEQAGVQLTPPQVEAELLAKAVVQPGNPHQ